MFKTTCAILIATTSALALPLNARAGWADYSAERTCHYIRQGYAPRKAGELGAYDTLKTSFGPAAMRAYDNGTMRGELQVALLRACPSTLLNQ